MKKRLPTSTDLICGTHCVYRHIRPDINQPFYVGIGKDSWRPYAKSKGERNEDWYKIVDELKEKGLEPIIEILFEYLTLEQACEKEIEFISLHGRVDKGTGILCNWTDGGLGFNGIVYHEKRIEKMKLIRSSPEYKENLAKQVSERHKINPNNYKPTLEQRQAASDRNKNREKFPCKYCQKLCDKQSIDRWHNENCKKSPTYITKISEKVICNFCQKEVIKGKYQNTYHFENCKKNPDNINLKKGDKEIQCPWCLKDGKRKSGMGFHIKTCKENPERIIVEVKTVTCPWCNKSGKATGMHTTHFDYCKENPNRINKDKTCIHCNYNGNSGTIKKYHNENCKLLGDKREKIYNTPHHQKEILRIANTGRKKSEETLKLLSLNGYFTKIAKEKETCPHCDFISNKGNVVKHIKRNHPNV